MEDDPALRARLRAVRDAGDPLASAVRRTQVAAALFGRREPVRIGRYDLLRGLGAGGGGTVFAARDPELDREIAIKVIVAAGSDRARALAEGQALARLSHPNVVPVYDVGTDGERVYLAMELVRGRSLRALAAGAGLREVVDAYRQAAAGLSAAHAAGLVHRDVKPDNLLLGDDGRVRVIDFGGGRTPGYMAPEQQRGAAVTAAADQYAFGMALAEGVRTAAGASPPRWLAAVIERATRDDAAARFPDLAALTRALADDPRRRWRRRAIVVAPLALAAIGFAVGRRDDGAAAAPACDGGAAALAPVWSQARTGELRAHIAGLGTPYAGSAAGRAAEALDGYAARWIAAHGDACRAAPREPSREVVERRSACLASARNQLGALADALLATGAAELPSAMRALGELPELAHCADPSALLARVAPPPPAQAAAAAALASRLERLQIAVEADAPDAAGEAAAALAEARALAYRPLIARALLALGRLRLQRGEYAEAAAPLAEAGDLAVQVGDDAIAVEAYARGLLATLVGDPGGALGGLGPVIAIASRLGPRDRFAVALLHNHAGVVAQAAGDLPRARAELDRALALARQVTGPGRVELAWARTNRALLTEDDAARAALHGEAVELARDGLGADHPLALELEFIAAYGRARPDDARAAMRPVCERFAALHPAQRGRVTDAVHELVALELAAGDDAALRRSTALLLAAAAGDTTPHRVARRELSAAVAAALAGDPAAATRALDVLAAAAAPRPDAVWHELLWPADVELARATVVRLTGQSDAAPRARAAALLERAAAENPSLAVRHRLAGARQSGM